MHRFFLFLIISLTQVYLPAQTTKIDSLKLALKKANTTEAKLSTLESLNKILISETSLKASLPYFVEMAEVAKGINNNELETRAYKYISETYMKEMDSTKAISFAKKALSINTKNKNLNGSLLDINQLGRVYHHFQLYKKAISTYTKGIDKYLENEDEKCLGILGQIYSNSSATYEKLGDNEASINAILKGVEIAEKTNSKDQKSYSLYALGYKYMELKNYEKAEDYFLKSLTFSDSVSLHTYTNMNHHGLGINYSRWGKYDKALYHNKTALDFFRKQGSKLYEFDVLNNIAVVYQRMNMPDSIIKYGNSALKVAKEINHKLAITGANLTLSNAYINKEQYNKAEEILLEVANDTVNPKVIDINSKASIYSNLSEVYEGKYNYQKSLKYYKIFKKLNDSIEKENLDSKFSELEIRYQTKKNEKAIEKLRTDNAEKNLEIKNKSFNNYILVSIIIVSILTLWLLITKLKKHKKELRKRQDRLVQEVKKGELLREMVRRLKKAPLEADGINDPEFHEFIIKTIPIKEHVLKVYIELAKGKSYKEIGPILGLQYSGTKTRMQKLYDALKIYSKNNIDASMTKAEAIEVFNNLFIEYQLNK